jgi:hypothetical protein
MILTFRLIPILIFTTEHHEDSRQLFVIVHIKMQLLALTPADGNGGTKIAKPEERPAGVKPFKMSRQGMLPHIMLDNLSGGCP